MALTDDLARLNDRQRRQVERLVHALTTPVETWVEPDSDIASAAFGDAMADVLRGHHAVSTKALGKEFFEHALASVFAELGYETVLSPMGFPGADLAVGGALWSLKTEGSQAIRPDFLHISKMMELGKGPWETESDLALLRDRMLQHLKGYDRIFSMRYLSGAKARRGQGVHEYELVEIPVELLRRAADWPCTMHMQSRQSPRPGDCKVMDEHGLCFELYFDGGSERKLQVRKLRLDLCTVHARWSFGAVDVDPMPPTPGADGASA